MSFSRAEHLARHVRSVRFLSSTLLLPLTIIVITESTRESDRSPVIVGGDFQDWTT